jgi:hypothetical protein
MPCRKESCYLTCPQVMKTEAPLTCADPVSLACRGDQFIGEHVLAAAAAGPRLATDWLPGGVFTGAAGVQVATAALEACLRGRRCSV